MMESQSNKLHQIRINRNVKLKETDWTQMPDSPIDAEKRSEFAIYRQALRDLPESTDNLDEIVWPVKPE